MLAEPLDAYPDISPPQVLVITEFPGQGAGGNRAATHDSDRTGDERRPQRVGRCSRTILGLSVVELVFDLGVKKVLPGQRMRNARTRWNSGGRRTRLGPLATDFGEIYRYELTSDGTTSPLKLRTLQDSGRRSPTTENRRGRRGGHFRRPRKAIHAHP